MIPPATNVKLLLAHPPSIATLNPLGETSPAERLPIYEVFPPNEIDACRHKLSYEHQGSTKI
jgi:hypothetical protein